MQPRALVKEFIKSPTWFWSFQIISVIIFASYIYLSIMDEVEPGNLWGIIYGSLSALLMLAVGLYGVRRRQMNTSSRLKLGKSLTWVQLHIYGGTLFLFLMFLHIDFKLPHGPLNWWLWSIAIWVTLSGFLGLFLQKWIPKMLSSALNIEVRYDRIEELVNELKGKADKEAAKAATPIKDFYNRTIAPEMERPVFRWAHFIDITGGNLAKIRQMDYLRELLSDEDLSSLDKIESYYLTKLECDAHYTLQRPLRIWLITHLPLSLLLFVLLFIHLYAVYYY